SMRTLAAVALGLSDNLITRAADVTLKERRRLVMMVRETPFNLAHLRNMTAVTEMGGIVFPPLPAFYHHPKTLEEMVDHTVARVLELVDVAVPGPSWEGMDGAGSDVGSDTGWGLSPSRMGIGPDPVRGLALCRISQSSGSDPIQGLTPRPDSFRKKGRRRQGVEIICVESLVAVVVRDAGGLEAGEVEQLGIHQVRWNDTR